MTENKTAELTILALNCGSSSLKFGLYACAAHGVKLTCEGEAEEIGSENASFSLGSPNGSEQRKKASLPNHAAALKMAIGALKECGAPEPQAVGHRIVHGGPHLREHQRATDKVMEELQAAIIFAPLHLPAALEVLKETQDRLPKANEVICLDTAFHRTMPEVSRTFALPAEVRQMGVERYGFHGLSLESILAQFKQIPERLVVAHLGNGSSITAIRDGKSMDTTMGLTPTGGVMMGTRCGDLDPGVVLYLMRKGICEAEKLEDVFDHHSGLAGVSGKSSDVRELLKARAQDRQADLALRMFCYQARKAIAGMAAALEGLDVLVFTGGIGEHAGELRDEICSGLKVLGDFKVAVLPAQEDLQIARLTAGLIMAG